MSDNGLSALAAALHPLYADVACNDWNEHEWATCRSTEQWLRDAAAILAALDGWTLVPTGSGVLLNGANVLQLRVAAPEAS